MFSVQFWEQSNQAMYSGWTLIYRGSPTNSLFIPTLVNGVLGVSSVHEFPVVYIGALKSEE